MTCLSVLTGPHIGVVTCRIGSSTCHTRHGKLTRTPNSLKSQFLMMISPISSHLSHSLPSPKNTKSSHPYQSFHAMIMIQHRVQHTPSTVSSEYCIIPRFTVSCSQPVSHLLADHSVLNSLHSHHYVLTNE